MRQSIVALCIHCCLLASVFSSAEPTTSSSSFSSTAPALATVKPVAPPVPRTGGYLDQWTFSTPCEQTGDPIYFTPGVCFYVPFLSNFNGYFLPAANDGYALVFYSTDNSTAYLYAFFDEECQQPAGWSYSSPIASITTVCGHSSPNIWGSPVLGPTPPEWPNTQLFAPFDLQFTNQTCSPATVNGLTLGQCYAAGTANPVSYYCDPTGSIVSTVNYSPGSYCEPGQIINIVQQATGCNMAAEPNAYQCPNVTGPAPPTIPGNSITLTWYTDYCTGAVINTNIIPQDVCFRNFMYHCNVNNGTYTQYLFTGEDCQTQTGSQITDIGCDIQSDTIVSCSNDLPFQSLFDLDATKPRNPTASPQITEY